MSAPLPDIIPDLPEYVRVEMDGTRLFGFDRACIAWSSWDAATRERMWGRIVEARYGLIEDALQRLQRRAAAERSQALLDHAERTGATFPRGWKRHHQRLVEEGRRCDSR